MRITMLDYALDYTPDVMRRLCDCGVDSLWVFNVATEEQVAPGEFRMERTPRYVERAKQAGFREIRIQSPIYLPKWVPDDWCLRNDRGEYSIHREPDADPGVLCQDMTSYWCQEAEDHARAYIVALREALGQNAIVVPAIGGSCGEYILPGGFRPGEGMISQHPSWLHDDHAQKSYQQSGLSRDAWWRIERKAIIRRRLSWYEEPWTCFVHTDMPRKAWSRGTVDIEAVIAELDPLPNTIIWCGLREDLLATTLEHAKRFPTWTGAEGSSGAVVNSRRIVEHGWPIRGLICGPTFAQYEGGFSEQVFQDIKTAAETQ